ncbi:hypothetical protein LCGC14_0327310 [marine sediment metagenome]|uniref:Uncharacterized protein n=1 Tax=marine sediment metagenome TaxID=412755 RepID=A0A0F9TMY0_9ZZZZ
MYLDIFRVGIGDKIALCALTEKHTMRVPGNISGNRAKRLIALGFACPSKCRKMEWRGLSFSEIRITKTGQQANVELNILRVRA